MTETQTEGLPNILLDDHLSIYLGKLPIDLYYFGRGHTDGDVVIHLPEGTYHRDGRSLRALGAVSHLIHYGEGGSARDWSRTLERALKLDFDVVFRVTAA